MQLCEHSKIPLVNGFYRLVLLQARRANRNVKAAKYGSFSNLKDTKYSSGGSSEHTNTSDCARRTELKQQVCVGPDRPAIQIIQGTIVGYK